MAQHKQVRTRSSTQNIYSDFAFDLLQHLALLSYSRPILSVIDQAEHMPPHKGSHSAQAGASKPNR